MKTACIAFAIVAIVVGCAGATGPGSTSANYLKLGFGARALAMGGAYTAIANDVSGVDRNPAGLAYMQTGEVAASHNAYVQGVYRGQVGVGVPAMGGVVCIAGSYLGSGDIEGMDENGDATGNFSMSGFSGVVGYGRGGPLAVGVSVAYLSDSIDDSKESGSAATLGCLWQATPTVSAGASVANVGADIGSDPLPLTYRVGGAATLGNVIVSAEAAMPTDNDLFVCAGAEWRIVPALAVRAGYNGGRDIGSGLSAGVGIVWTNLGLDYAYTPLEDLGFANHITATVRF